MRIIGRWRGGELPDGVPDGGDDDAVVVCGGAGVESYDGNGA
jgi:hypothetical protein